MKIVYMLLMISLILITLGLGGLITKVDKQIKINKEKIIIIEKKFKSEEKRDSVLQLKIDSILKKTYN